MEKELKELFREIVGSLPTDTLVEYPALIRRIEKIEKIFREIESGRGV